MAATQPVRTLNDGRIIPAVGLGVYMSEPGPETYDAVRAALATGYRHIDTASFYNNEADVGRAVRESGIPRDEIWITTKFFLHDESLAATPDDARALVLAEGKASFEKLGTYIDLYLMHAPFLNRIAMWQSVQELQAAGIAKSIGVSNFGAHHLEELLAAPTTTVVPAVNQLEIHPWLRRDALAQYGESKGIATQAYSPLAKATMLQDPALVSAAATVGKSPAQVLIRWSLDKGYITLPKSANPARIAANFDVFAFELPADVTAALDVLDCHKNTDWDPIEWPL